jgi:hypothetical protein
MLGGKIATPHAARNFLKALRGLMVVAITAGSRVDDPTREICNVKLRVTGGFRTWNEDEIAQFEAIHPIGSRARLAFAAALYRAAAGRRDSHGPPAGSGRVHWSAATKNRHGFGNPDSCGLTGGLVLQPGRAFDLFNNQSGGAFQGAGLHKLVPRYVSRGGLATWRYTKAADQKRMATAAMEAASKTKTGTNTGKPLTKVSQISSQPIENKA